MERKPNITLSSLDLDRIESLLKKNNSQFPGRDALEAELDRADVLDPAEIPANVVTMNSTVRFTILEIAKTNTLTLVYPKDMDGSADKVSIFAPVGIALLGLSVGDEFKMPSPTGVWMPSSSSPKARASSIAEPAHPTKKQLTGAAFLLPGSDSAQAGQHGGQQTRADQACLPAQGLTP